MALINRNWLYLLSGLILISLMWYFSDVVAYVLIAWVVSLLGRPIMHFYLNRIKIGKYRIGNTGASLLTIFSIFAFLFGIIAPFVPTLVHQANNFATLDYQALGEKLQGPFSWLDLQAHRFGVIKPGTSLATEIQTALLQWFQPSMVSDIVGGVFATAGGIVVTISAVSFILFFFLQEQGLFSEIIDPIVPTEYGPKVLKAIDNEKVLK